MRVTRVVCLLALLILVARPSLAQTSPPDRSTVTAGADIGFLAGYYAEADTGAAFDVFAEYYFSPWVRVRGLYGSGAATTTDAVPRHSIRRQQLTMNAVVGYPLGRFHPFATVGAGANFFEPRRTAQGTGDSFTKLGANVGWGVEFDLRAVVLRSEMNLQLVTDDDRLTGLGDEPLSGFTWAFGLKVPLRRW